MTKVIKQLALLFVLFKISIAKYTLCYNCNVRNDAESVDEGHCLYPAKSKTVVSSCLFGCATYIYPSSDHLVLNRTCYQESVPTAENACSGSDLTRTCTCNKDYCNTDRWKFTCYQCAYSSSGRDLALNGRIFIGHESCKKPTEEETGKVDCETRCMESMHQVFTKSGDNPDVLIFRDCAKNHGTPPMNVKNCGIFQQCGTSKCNKSNFV